MWFKAGRNAIMFRSNDLERPFVTHNEDLLAVIGPQLEAELKERNHSADVGKQVSVLTVRAAQLHLLRAAEFVGMQKHHGTGPTPFI